MFDCCVRRARYKGKFELVYTSSSQVIVKRLSTGSRIILKSNFGHSIGKIDIFKDQFLVAHTDETLLVGDLATCKLSEINWHHSQSEKFYFDIENFCMIFNAGELNIVEYGVNEIIGSCRTEFTNPHLISIRFEENKKSSQSRMIAYLVDAQTIQVVNLTTGFTVATISHDCKIDWLEVQFLFSFGKEFISLAFLQCQQDHLPRQEISLVPV